MRFAIIGAGAIGLEHLRNILTAGDPLSVVAIADSAPESLRLARQTVRQYEGVDEAKIDFIESHSDLLTRPDVDALIICTPNFHHVQILRELFAAGCEKPVLCEKPLCTTTGDCLEVRRMVQEAGTMFWVGMEYRYVRKSN